MQRFLVAAVDNKSLRAISQCMFVLTLSPYEADVLNFTENRWELRTLSHKLRSFCYNIREFHFQSVYKFDIIQCIDEMLMGGKGVETEQ